MNCKHIVVKMGNFGLTVCGSYFMILRVTRVLQNLLGSLDQLSKKSSNQHKSAD